MTIDAIACHPLVPALNTLSALATSATCDELLRSVVRFARQGIGLERVALFTRDPTPQLAWLRGSWAVTEDGELRDASGVFHECSASEHASLLRLRAEGRAWKRCDPAHARSIPWSRPNGAELSWVVATPVIIAQRLVAVLYNGSTRSKPVDDAQQQQAALLCNGLGVLLLPPGRQRAPRVAGRPSPRRELIERTLAAVADTPKVRGEVLAQRFDVSAGHLARLFKREVGMSLVDYRHRVLMQRFFAAMAQGNPSLVDAVRAAGFGSYAQFHRVYRRLMSAAPQGIAHARPSLGASRDGKPSRLASH